MRLTCALCRVRRLELVLPYATGTCTTDVDAAAFWSVLRGAAGLRAKRWRARAAAVRVAGALVRLSPGAVASVDVAEAVLLRLALEDTQREVRVASGVTGAILLGALGDGADSDKLASLLAALLVRLFACTMPCACFRPTELV